jgi:hypothetical protein
MLLLRAGIDARGPTTPRAVARTLRIGVAREGRLEHAAVLELQRAARQHSCGSIPAWLHVPARNRLVRVDPVLATATQPATNVSFMMLNPVGTGSPLLAGPADEWWRLTWVPAPEG